MSAGHATLATCLTVASLYQPWFIPPTQDQSQSPLKDHHGAHLNDSHNPLIQGRNHLANFVTAWEAGYLIYDVGAMFLESHTRNRSRGYRPALVRLLRTSPLFVVHHVLIAGALLILQAYIVAGRERGVKILMAFILMNASTPLLHLRWWRRKATGRSDRCLDVLLALVFAITRFGGVQWVMKSYGQYHNIDAWRAFRQQRIPCQVGTGLVTTLNALWWLSLLKQMVRRRKALT